MANLKQLSSIAAAMAYSKSLLVSSPPEGQIIESALAWTNSEHSMMHKTRVKRSRRIVVMECRVHILPSCAYSRLQLHRRSRQQLTSAADGQYAHRCWYGAYQACGKTDIISIEHERESGSFDRIANSSPYVLKLFDKELSSDCFNRGFLPACLVES